MSAPATMPADPGSAPSRGAWLREVWRSTIGKKILIATTGAIMVAYVVLHALGNLKAFQGVGADGAAIDAYSEWLRTIGEPAVPRSGLLWVVRVVLLAALLIHVTATVQLHARNKAARPVGHRVPRIQRSLSSRTMFVGGLFLLGFIVFHVLHLTTGTVDPGAFAEGAVYRNLDEAFQNPLFVLIYVAAALALGFHLHHAIWSTTQTAGWDAPNRNPTFRRASTFIGAAVAICFAAVPIAFWTGILEAPR